MTRMLAVFMLLFGASSLPGCIVQDIHDQLEASNAELARINRTIEQLERTNTLLTSIEVRLSSIDERLVSVDERLGSVDERLATLRVLLDAVSEHLASLRRTINNIDSTIPFLKFSGDDAEAKEGLEVEGDPTLPTESPQPETPQPEGSGPDRTPALANPQGARAEPGNSAADGI